MSKPNTVEVPIRLVVENPKAFHALRVIASTLEDVAEDFEYRDDVKRAIKAAKYLIKNLTYQVTDAGADKLLENGCEFVDDDKGTT
jgi:hypothetical protein